MKNLIALILLFITSACYADVIVPQDTEPITISKDDVVRITERSMAGSKIEIKINNGKAAITEENVSYHSNGKPLIGSTFKSFTIKPDGPGVIKFTVTIIRPIPDAPAIIKNYEVNVQ